MTQYVNASALDAQLDYLINNAAQLVMVPNYATSDTRAAVLAAAIVTINVTPADFSKSSHATTGRKLAIAQKSGYATAAADGTGDHHWVLVSATGVLAAWDETGNDAVEVGALVNAPPYEYRLVQPVVQA